MFMNLMFFCNFYKKIYYKTRKDLFNNKKSPQKEGFNF